MSVPFDARPLTDPVDRREVKALARSIPKPPLPTANIVVYMVLAILFPLTLIPVAITGMVLLVAAGLPFVAALIVIIVIGVAVLVVLLIRSSLWRAKEKNFRLNRFAQANHMAFIPQVDDPPLPGMIFQRGHSRVSRQIVRGTHPRFVEFGNYRYTTGSGKNQSLHTWGYVAVKLDVPLPNIVLDATGNNSFLGSNLPSQFAKEQRLSLEGDFDQFFSLYCPTGYETDALYLFTPDIMARFIDNAAQLDVEIVDDWLFLYTSREASTLDAATWAWLFSAVAALLTKFDQWARWRDERLAGNAATSTVNILPFAAPVEMLTPPPGVAPEGRRLKTTFSWVSVVVLVAFVAFQIVSNLLFGR